VTAANKGVVFVVYIRVILFVLLPAHGLKCMICLVEFSEGEDMKELPCCHLFHPRCILPWLEKVLYFTSALSLSRSIFLCCYRTPELHNLLERNYIGDF